MCNVHSDHNATDHWNCKGFWYTQQCLGIIAWLQHASKLSDEGLGKACMNEGNGTDKNAWES